MFQVRNKVSKSIENVYSVNVTENQVLFLIYSESHGDWVWIDSSNYEPIK
jgi:hypothetical protein